MQQPFDDSLDSLKNDEPKLRRYLSRKVGFEDEAAGLSVYERYGYLDFENGNKAYFCFCEFLDSAEYMLCAYAGYNGTFEAPTSSL